MLMLDIHRDFYNIVGLKEDENDYYVRWFKLYIRVGVERKKKKEALFDWILGSFMVAKA